LYVWQTGRSNVDVIALNCDQLVHRQQHSDIEISFGIAQHKAESLSFGLLIAAFQTVRKYYLTIYFVHNGTDVLNSRVAEVQTSE
jgi:hypothetical protein